MHRLTKTLIPLFLFGFVVGCNEPHYDPAELGGDVGEINPVEETDENATDAVPNPDPDAVEGEQ